MYREILGQGSRAGNRSTSRWLRDRRRLGTTLLPSLAGLPRDPAGVSPPRFWPVPVVGSCRALLVGPDCVPCPLREHAPCHGRKCPNVSIMTDSVTGHVSVFKYIRAADLL